MELSRQSPRGTHFERTVATQTSHIPNPLGVYRARLGIRPYPSRSIARGFSARFSFRALFLARFFRALFCDFCARFFRAIFPSAFSCAFPRVFSRTFFARFVRSFFRTLFPRAFQRLLLFSFHLSISHLYIFFQHRPGNMDVDPDPSRRFSPVRIPKRFCRRIDLLRIDGIVAAIAARDPF